MKRVIARAYANIALVKYWGKKPGLNNVPATPSISLTLKALKTETVIEKHTAGEDRFYINGKPADKQSQKRLENYIDYWRKTGLIDGNFKILSSNNFPTKAGLASSSSGYAALAVGLSGFTKFKISRQELSRLARIGSGSAARSVAGGLAALPLNDNPAARTIIPFDEVPWGMVIAEVDRNSKDVSSRQGMEINRKFSPYYESWVKQAVKDYKKMIKALRNLDFTAVGEIAEANALAMHACMISSRPSLLYWSPVTFKIIQTVKKWRKKGFETYFTIDAGPNVILLGKKEDLSKIARRIRNITGVKSVTVSRAGEGARIIDYVE